MTFRVLANGIKGFAYILHNELYEVDIAQYRSKNEDFYPVSIKVKSDCLWSMGPYKAVDTIYNWVNDNIGKVINNKLSRIDLCCHTDEIQLTAADAENFKGLYYDNNMYFHRRKVNGMNFGSSGTGKVYCRIYDKVLEITKKKSKTWFYEIWKKNGLDCKNVWNIEFQINREYLKEHYIETVWQVFDRLGSIWEYCTTKWLVKTIPDNNNISRCSINPVWIKVQEAFKDFNARPLIKRSKQLSADAEAIIPAAYGTFTTFAAKKGITDVGIAISLFQKLGDAYLRNKCLSFGKVVKKKLALVDKARKKPETMGELEKMELQGDMQAIGWPVDRLRFTTWEASLL